MKYIVLTGKNDDSVIRFPFIFSSNFVHAHAEKVLSLLVSLMFMKYDWTCTSAGEISSMDFAGECYGESTTLGVKSNPEDTALLKGSDYGSAMIDI